MMRIVITILELLILFIIVWLIFPKLVFGREFSHILPGIRLATTLSLKHLVLLAVVVLCYGVFAINNGPGLIGASLLRLSPVIKALALFTLAFGVYLHALPTHFGDTIPAKLIPISIVEEGNIDLDEFRYAIFGRHSYCMIKRNDHFYSTYPVYAGITVTPFYAAMKWMAPEMFGLWRQEYSQRNGDLLNGFVQLLHHYSAAMISSLAVVFFWLIAHRLGVPAIVSLPTTIAFAFGTPMMSSMASSLWTHGPAILFMLLAVFSSATCQEEEQTNLGLLFGGLFAAWSIACRPTGLVAAFLLTIYVLYKYRKRAVFFIMPFFLLLSTVAFFNFGMYGKLFGGYQGQVSHFTIPTAQRMFYLLMSPSRGLLPFVPFVILFVFYIQRVFQRKVDLLTLAVFAVAGEIGIYSCWSVWWGGDCFGPRLLADCIMWCLLGILAANVQGISLHRLRPKAIWFGGLVLVAYSVCLHVTGGIYGDKKWNAEYFKEHPERLMHWKNSQVMWTLTDIRYDPDNDWKKNPKRSGE
ncbi:MAG: hypothetical protein KKA76_09520 [Proteobacteria bacterium]|nr:hypothetical protein [Pseudomonadota bacterium]